MADGPRCKRRKQANPKRSSDVTNFNNGLEASSDSDDEDKLHIVEEDSLQDTEAGAEGATAKESHKNTTKTTATTVLPQNGDCNGVNEVNEEEEVSEEEAEGEKDALVEEILQQGDTAIIYPEAPEEEEQSAAETGGADENGTPDPLLQLHICPYCSRGYKRNASLKEHIKYRHETSDDNYSCSHCSYTFTYRSQLERHMSHHRGSKDERHTSSQSSGGSGGTRKFKCTECSKAFKYKHHLKEHLRIHSGEKPYECSNCKKRFSHSGSYSSHISSKKCAAANCPNGVSQSSIKPPLTGSQPAPVAIAPARVILKDKMESKPLQEQIPVTQIKTEPEEEDIKPVIVPPVTSNGVNRATVGATLPQGVAMVVPTLGLVSPISININDLQNVLKVAMDGNVLRQVLGNANGAVAQGKQGIVVQQPQQQIISLPAFVDHDGTTKIIINYSISPTAATTANTQPTNLVVKNSPPVAAAVPIAAAAPIPSKTEQSCATKEEQVEVATDLSIVKAEPEAVAISEPTEEGTVKSQAEPSEQPALAQMPKSNTCLLCDDCPEHLEALHLLQHRKAANGEAVDSAALDPSFADLLSEAGVTLDEPSPADDVLSVLKTSFASNANPSDSELGKISENISIPVNVVRKWFAKMNNGKKAVVEKREPEDDIPIQTERTQEETQNSESQTTPSPPLSPNRDLVIVKSEPEDPDAPDSQAEPLDLSLPKSASGESTSENVETPSPKQQRPLNLACLSKGQLEGRTIYVTTPQAGNPVNIVTATQIPTLVAIAGQGGMGACLSAINTTTKQRTILIPQLTYTYATAAGNAAGNKTVVLNGHKKEKKPESAVKSALPAVEQESDSDMSAKKRKLLDAGVYPCDLCSKVFQKGSSLLRHKYEHTGKRPHECIVCKKAFKHKHHLIEHARLHTGIKPYQCDKCGKRFSHSGSYSQHMNHRYSYCKRTGNSSPTNAAETQHGSNNNSGDGADSPVAAQHLDSLNASERDDSVEEEEDDEEAMCMDDIRVVQVDDGEEQEEMGQEEAEEMAQEEAEDEAGDEAGDEPVQDKTEDGEKESGEVMEIELGEVEDEGSEEKMEENGEVEGKDCDKHIREGSGDGEPTSENAK